MTTSVTSNSRSAHSERNEVESKNAPSTTPLRGSAQAADSNETKTLSSHQGTRAQSPVVPPSLTDILSVHFVPTNIGCPVNAGLAESSTVSLALWERAGVRVQGSAQERTSAAAFRMRLAVYDLTSLADALSPTFLRHRLWAKLSAGDEFCQGNEQASDIRLRRVHEVPIIRLARRLRFAQDTAWGSAPVNR